jgi:hypothetical protein
MTNQAMRAGLGLDAIGTKRTIRHGQLGLPCPFPFVVVIRPRLQPPWRLSSCLIGREVRAGDHPSRPHGPFLLRLHVARRGAVEEKASRPVASTCRTSNNSGRRTCLRGWSSCGWSTKLETKGRAAAEKILGKSQIGKNRWLRGRSDLLICLRRKQKTRRTIARHYRAQVEAGHTCLSGAGHVRATTSRRFRRRGASRPGGRVPQSLVGRLGGRKERAAKQVKAARVRQHVLVEPPISYLLQRV